MLPCLVYRRYIRKKRKKEGTSSLSNKLGARYDATNFTFTRTLNKQASIRFPWQKQNKKLLTPKLLCFKASSLFGWHVDYNGCWSLNLMIL